MAHPQNAFPDAVFLIDAISQPIRPKGGSVYAIQNISAGDQVLEVKSNVFEYVASGGSLTNHIDPTTGNLGVASKGLVDSSGNTTASGYYELDNADLKEITIKSGHTIYGKFSDVELKTGSTGPVLAYCTTRRQVGLEL